MRTSLMAIALWLVATTLAVAVGISATRLVADRVAAAPATIPVGLTENPSEAIPTAEPGGSPAPSTSPVGSLSPPASPSPVALPSAAQSSAVQTRTVSVVGGSAALRFIDGRVEVVWATPNAGFTADVEHDPDGAEARVDFRSEEHRSRIKGEWEAGQPYVETEERPDE